VRDPDALVEALKAQGLSVERAGDVSQPFFSVGGRALTVNGENVQVFRYATAEAAEREAGQVSPDGSGTATSMVSWERVRRYQKTVTLKVADGPRFHATLFRQPPILMII
jgi:hypothetical protein